MQDSRTFRRSRSSMSLRFHPSVIALVIAAVILGPCRRWRRLVILGIVSVVFLAACGGGSQPTPTILTISPNSVVAGGAAFTLTINGTNFVASSMVNFGGAVAATTFVNSTQLTAAIPASSIVSIGTLAVTVTNPAPAGGTSNPMGFTVSGSDPQSIAVDPTGKFAYVMNGDGGAGSYVSMYTINPTTGALTSIGPPVSTYGYSAYGESLTVDPFGKFVYATNSGDVYDFGDGANGNLAMYTINATTGALTSIGTIPVEGSADSVVVDPSGKFVYVASASGTPGSAGSVSMYTINATTGALASTGTIAAGAGPVSVVVDPSGKFAYVANFNSNDVSMYTIDVTTGALTPTGTIAAGLSPTSIAVHPSGKFAYVTNSAANDVSMYSIDGATGALTLIGTIGT